MIIHLVITYDLQKLIWLTYSISPLSISAEQPATADFTDSKVIIIQVGSIRKWAPALTSDFANKQSLNRHYFREPSQITLISLISVEIGINVEGVQKLPNH